MPVLRLSWTQLLSIFIKAIASKVYTPMAFCRYTAPGEAISSPLLTIFLR